MKLTLTESLNKFIESLDETDRAKLVITDNTMESTDPNISDKLFKFGKARLAEVGEEIRAFNKQLREEHPEYFE